MKKIILLGYFLAVLLGITACSTKGSTEQTEAIAVSAKQKAVITLTDNAGREVELPIPVETCVVANRYNSELIRACGAVDRIIAVDQNTAQDREYWGMFDPENTIGKSQTDLNYEKIARLNPQVLILPDNGSYEEAEKQLEPFGIKVFVISGYDTADFKNQVENIGVMFGVEEPAQRFYHYFNDKVEYIKKQLDGQPKKTVYFESTSDYNTTLPGDPFYNMVELAGVENIFASQNSGISQKEVDPEAIISRNPELIIKLVTPEQALSGTGLYEPPSKDEFETKYEELTSRPGWDSVKAVKNQDIYFMTQFSHGGAGKLVGTMYIAKMAYPDLLTELDPDEVFRAWMEDFQGFQNVDGHFYSAAELLN